MSLQTKTKKWGKQKLKVPYHQDSKCQNKQTNLSQIQVEIWNSLVLSTGESQGWSSPKIWYRISGQKKVRPNSDGKIT